MKMLTKHLRDVLLRVERETGIKGRVVSQKSGHAKIVFNGWQYTCSTTPSDHRVVQTIISDVKRHFAIRRGADFPARPGTIGEQISHKQEERKVKTMEKKKRSGFRRGALIQRHRGLGADVLAALDHCGWTQDRLAAFIKDPRGVGTSGNTIGAVVNLRYEEGRHMGQAVFDGLCKFIAEHGPHRMREHYRNLIGKKRGSAYVERNIATVPKSELHIAEPRLTDWTKDAEQAPLITAFNKLDPQQQTLFTNLVEEMARVNDIVVAMDMLRETIERKQ